MNERIKEITGQVLDELVPETWVALGYDKIKEIQLRTAELIIRECVDILDPNGAYAEKYKHAHVPGPDGSRTPLSPTEFENMQSAQKLRDHFGVEE